MKPGKGIKTIAMKVNAAEVEKKKALARDLLGGMEIYTEPGLHVFQLPDGCIMELYGPGSNYPDYLFEKSDMVLSFRVPDVKQAIHHALQAGMEVISGIQQLGTCFSYCYLRDKKGMIFGITN
jgi:hypothetical protein